MKSGTLFAQVITKINADINFDEVKPLFIQWHLRIHAHDLAKRWQSREFYTRGLLQNLL